MKNGNWVPICKAAVKTLPINRAFSEVEALFSLSCDYDNNKAVSESGFSKRWGWSRKKVRLFLERIGVNILYQADKKRSPLGGQVGVQVGDKLGTSLGQVRFIDFSNLEEQRDKLGTREGQARDKLGDTTIDPDPKPDPKPKEKDLKSIVEKSEIPFKEIIEYLNLKTGKRYQHTTPKTQSFIKTRWNEGFKSLDDYKHVIDVKCHKWLNTEDEKFLRPETLFGTKFEGYLNERIIENSQSSQIPKATTTYQAEMAKRDQLFRALREEDEGHEYEEQVGRHKQITEDQDSTKTIS